MSWLKKIEIWIWEFESQDGGYISIRAMKDLLHKYGLEGEVDRTIPNGCN